MDVERAITQRRSIREYNEDDVSNEHVDAVLEAGRWAPSGLNNQPWKFKIVKGDEKEHIAQYTKYSRIISDAPVCIAVFLDESESYNRDKDLQAVGACIQNMLLRIEDLGLAGVWLGEILNHKLEVQQALGTEHELMAVIAFGHPQAEKRQGTRKELKELVL